MAKLKKESGFWINGDKLMEVMTLRCITAGELAEKSGVSYQAILNYQKSTSLNAKKADVERVSRIAAVLEVDVQDLCFTPAELSKCIEPFEIGFFGYDADGTGPVDAKGRLTLAGKWTVTATLTGECAAEGPWSEDFQAELRQIEAKVGAWLVSEEAEKDTSSCRPSKCRVTANTLESGNLLALQYAFDSAEARVYGFAMLAYWGDELFGHFVGRNTRRRDVILTGSLRAQRCPPSKSKPR